MVAVTTTLSNSLPNSARMVFRMSNGIPVVLEKQSDTTWYARVGNAVIPSDFGSGAGSSLNTQISGLSGAMDANDLLHVCWIDNAGKAPQVKYTTVDCTIPQAQPFTIVVADIGEIADTTKLYTAIAIDANNAPHLVCNTHPKIAGVVTYTCLYYNMIGGSWNSAKTIWYYANQNCSHIDILINQDNIPVVTLSTETYCRHLYADANNPTTFTEFSFGSLIATEGNSMVQISNGNYYRAIVASSVVTIYFKTVANGWGGFISLQTFACAATSRVSLTTAGNDVFVFYENAANAVAYRKVTDIAVGDEIVLAAGSFNTVIAKWANYFNNGSNQIDYVYVDETATPDIQWGSLSLSAPISWMNKPLKWFNGSSWVEKPLKYHNGSSWITTPLKTNL